MLKKINKVNLIPECFFENIDYLKRERGKKKRYCQPKNAMNGGEK